MSATVGMMAIVMGCVASGSSSYQASAFVTPLQLGIRPTTVAAPSPKTSIPTARDSHIAEPRRSRKPPTASLQWSSGWDWGRAGTRSYRSSCLKAEASTGSNSPLTASSRRGLVFPTEVEDGWFDSATVGSPRVHRCKTCLRCLRIELGRSKVMYVLFSLEIWSRWLVGAVGGRISVLEQLPQNRICPK